jgi:hypothetical protein
MKSGTSEARGAPETASPVLFGSKSGSKFDLNRILDRGHGLRNAVQEVGPPSHGALEELVVIGVATARDPHGGCDNGTAASEKLDERGGLDCRHPEPATHLGSGHEVFDLFQDRAREQEREPAGVLGLVDSCGDRQPR